MAALMILASVLAMAEVGAGAGAEVPQAAPAKAKRALPANNPATWVTTSDYPAAALRVDGSGTTDFMLKISASGRVETCSIVSGSGSAVLDETTCRLISERARFYPAVDAQGGAVPGNYVSRVRWVLPPRPDLPQPGNVVMRFVVEPDGSRSHCEALEVSGAAAAQIKPGPLACPPIHYAQPYKDTSGNPVRRRVTMTMTTGIIVEEAPN